MSLLSRPTPHPAAVHAKTDTEKIRQLIQEKHDLLRLLNEAGAEVQALHALLDGKVPEAAAWLMSKVARQRAALDAMNVKAVSRRLVLRAFTEAGYKLSPEQWAQVREWFAMGRPGWDERLPKEPPAGEDE